jgi:hypothetical protein
MTFDFCAHELQIRTNDARAKTVKLEPKSVAQFYAETMDALAQLGSQVGHHADQVESGKRLVESLQGGAGEDRQNGRPRLDQIRRHLIEDVRLDGEQDEIGVVGEGDIPLDCLAVSASFLALSGSASANSIVSGDPGSPWALAHPDHQRPCFLHPRVHGRDFIRRSLPAAQRFFSSCTSSWRTRPSPFFFFFLHFLLGPPRRAGARCRGPLLVSVYSTVALKATSGW